MLMLYVLFVLKLSLLDMLLFNSDKRLHLEQWNIGSSKPDTIHIAM